ncbi:hypothetical protein EV359DRAFT_80037 [Lentinula novae-zelandiae]|nr:hypothetical protein EV359DRAFT_80037 [Lentinula novae-zelandiae]
MFKQVRSAILLSALAVAVPVVRAQSTVALSWNSTSPYGQSNGDFTLVQGTYGYAMAFTADSSSSPTATYSEEFGSLVQHCPEIGYIAALIPQSGVIPETYILEWVDPTITLPEGSSTNSLVPAPGGFVSTLGTGIFKGIEVDNTGVFAWVNETSAQDGGVQYWIVTTPDSTTC